MEGSGLSDPPHESGFAGTPGESLFRGVRGSSSGTGAGQGRNLPPWPPGRRPRCPPPVMPSRSLKPQLSLQASLLSSIEVALILYRETK